MDARLDKELSNLVLLLGDDNVEKIKTGITEIILDRVRDDFDDYGCYLFYPPDMQALMDEVIEEIEKKVKKMYKDAVIKVNEDYIEKMKQYIASEFSEANLRSEIIRLANTYYWRSNEYGAERKFAEELRKILGMTQEDLYTRMEEKNA